MMLHDAMRSHLILGQSFFKIAFLYQSDAKFGAEEMSNKQMDIKSKLQYDGVIALIVPTEHCVMAFHSIVILALIAKLNQSFCYLDKGFTWGMQISKNWSGQQLEAPLYSGSCTKSPLKILQFSHDGPNAVIISENFQWLILNLRTCTIVIHTIFWKFSNLR